MSEEMMRAASIYEQTGWKRPGHRSEMICQDMDTLLSVYEYDFDLNDRGFRAYFTARTGIDFYGCFKDRLQDWSFRDIFAHYFAYYVANPDRMCDEFNAKENADIDVKIIKILRGRLQDCWELYNRITPEEKERERLEKNKLNQERWTDGNTF